mgnify:CR=1 FL=1
MEKQNILDKKGQHIRSGRVYISTSYFLYHRELLRISYDIKNSYAYSCEKIISLRDRTRRSK